MTAAPHGVSARRDAVRRTLFERLVMLAAPDIANRILDDAMRRGRLAEIPDGGHALEHFARGVLRDAVEFALGDDFAEAFLDDFEPILRGLCGTPSEDDSRVRIAAHQGLPPHGAMPTPIAPAPVDAFDVAELDDSIDVLLEEPVAEPAHRPTSVVKVVVATRSKARARELAESLGDEADVRQVEDVFDLVDSAQTTDDVVVVLDSTESTVRPTTLAAASAELPDDAKVVLWGTDQTESDELDAIVPDAENWLRLGESTSPTELAFFLRFALKNRTR